MESPGAAARNRSGGSSDASDISSRANCQHQSLSNSSPSVDQKEDCEDANDNKATFHRKSADILAACQRRDLGRLRFLAEAEGGLLTDALRRRAWPILLGLPVANGHGEAGVGSDSGLQKPEAPSGSWKELPAHRDEEQVELDVNRSFIYYPSNMSEPELRLRKAELSALINEVLRRHPFLCYFQGYHDICQVFLLVLDPVCRAQVVARLSVLRIRDFMLPSLGPTTSQLRLLPDILADADPELRHHLAGIEPFYALAGTLTMYAHNIEGYRDIARLFDVLLAREPVFSIYVFAQIILDRRDEIFQIDEPDMLHVILGKVPPKMNLDDLITKSVSLFERCPPEALRSWRSISNSSVLKTARDVEVCSKQSMEDGKGFFQKQVKELQWVELQNRIKWALWKYRRPAKAIGLAVAVAAAAVYLRRHPAVLSHITKFFS